MQQRNEDDDSSKSLDLHVGSLVQEIDEMKFSIQSDFNKFLTLLSGVMRLLSDDKGGLVKSLKGSTSQVKGHVISTANDLEQKVLQYHDIIRMRVMEISKKLENNK